MNEKYDIKKYLTAEQISELQSFFKEICYTIYNLNDDIEIQNMIIDKKTHKTEYNVSGTTKPTKTSTLSIDLTVGFELKTIQKKILDGWCRQ